MNSPLKTSAQDNTGAILFEAMFVAAIFGFLLITTHIKVIQLWRDKLTELERKKTYYNGRRTWTSSINGNIF